MNYFLFSPTTKPNCLTTSQEVWYHKSSLILGTPPRRRFVFFFFLFFLLSVHLSSWTIYWFIITVSVFFFYLFISPFPALMVFDTLLADQYLAKCGHLMLWERFSCAERFCQGITIDQTVLCSFRNNACACWEALWSLSCSWKNCSLCFKTTIEYWVCLN